MRIFFLIAMSTYLSAYSQTNVKFQFEARDSNLRDTNFVSKNDKNKSFWIEREIKNDSTFIDSPLLCRAKAKECSVMYKKIGNGNWLIYGDNKWSILFDQKNDRINKVLLAKDSLFLIPNKTYNIESGKRIYEFQVKDKAVIEPENNTIYLFNPELGIIGIQNPSTTLVRADFK